MIRTDGKPTIAMREGDVVNSLDSVHSFKEYTDLDGNVSHFLILEVQGDRVNAEDLRNNIEKLEYPGLGISFVMSLEEIHARLLTKN